MSRPQRLDRTSFRLTVAAALVGLLPIAPQFPLWLLVLLVALGGGAWLLGERRMVSGWIRVPLTLGIAILVLAAFGKVGREAGAALLATMLVLKLFETRSLRDARLVASFSLFAAMAAFLFDQGPLTLALATVAVVTGFLALTHLADATPPAPRSLQWRRDLPPILRVLGLSVPLALVAFFLFPRLAQPLWGLPETLVGSRTGISETMTPGDFAKLLQDDRPAFRVRFDDPPPPPGQLYWRGPVLWFFDGRTWQRAPWADRTPPAPLAAHGPTVRYEVTLEPTEHRYVFPLEHWTGVPDGLSASADGSLLAPQRITQLSRFHMASAPQAVVEPQLARTPRHWALQLPDGYNPRTLELAAAWRRENDNPHALVRRALDLFNREFHYTLEPPLLGRDSVDDFLFETRRGFCEHYASAFVVLMRAAGVPARVVLGYQGGLHLRFGDYWLIRNSDAHAWAEVWIEGEGWRRVDPTAAIAPQRTETGAGGTAGGDGLQRGWFARQLRDLRASTDWIRRGWNDVVLGFNALRQQQMLRPLGLDTGDWRGIGIAFAVAAALATALTLLLALRRRGPQAPAPVRAWRGLLRRLRRAGLALPVNATPLQVAERLRQTAPSPALDELIHHYIGWRYGAETLDLAAQRRLARQLRRARPPAIRPTPPPHRRRLPP